MEKNRSVGERHYTAASQTQHAASISGGELLRGCTTTKQGFGRNGPERLALRYGIEIALDARIGAGMKINHGYGIVIRPECVIGNNLNIRHGVTIGRESSGDCRGLTVIGNNVDIGAQVCIIGDVRITAWR